MLEVRLPLLGVVAADVGVADEQHPLPGLVDAGEVVVVDVEDIVDKLETLYTSARL